MKRIVPALPCHLIAMKSLLVHKRAPGEKNDDGQDSKIYPDLRIYQAGDDAQRGLHFCLRYVSMLHPIERINPRKIYITFAIPFDSEAYLFLKELNERVREFIQRHHLKNTSCQSTPECDAQIMDIFDETNGTVRLLMNRATRFSKNVFVPCEMEISGEPKQIFQIEPTRRMHISVNLQHIWGLASDNKTNHLKKSIHAPMLILKSILLVDEQ